VSTASTPVTSGCKLPLQLERHSKVFAETARITGTTKSGAIDPPSGGEIALLGGLATVLVFVAMQFGVQWWVYSLSSVAAVGVAVVAEIVIFEVFKRIEHKWDRWEIGQNNGVKRVVRLHYSTSGAVLIANYVGLLVPLLLYLGGNPLAPDGPTSTLYCSQSFL
jgi:hypothetical protein